MPDVVADMQMCPNRSWRIARSDTLALVFLLALTTLSWCAAWGIWGAADLKRPLQYLNPEYGDFIATSAGVKAITEGQFRPFLWKYVRFFGAPFEANWNDTPLVEELQFILFATLARVFGLFAGFNIGLLLGHLAAAATFFGVARVSACSILWSLVSALAFALAPFAFAQSPHHITCEYIWHIPLFLLVWRWVATCPGLSPSSARFRCALLVAAVTGVQNPYFTNIFCQLVLMGGAITAWRTRTWRPLLGAVCVVGVAAFAFSLMNVDSWSYALLHEPNSAGLVREYKWLEIYGLKIKDFVIPPVTHRWDVLAQFAKVHRQAAPLLDEGAAYQGIVGVACLLWLIATAITAVVEKRDHDFPAEAWQVLWIVLMFTTGGLNAIIGVMGFTMFRTGCRYSVVILAIVLLWAARRLSRSKVATESASHDAVFGRHSLAAAGLACLVILSDQVPRAPTAEEIADITRQVAADRKFTERMESSLSVGAMVFQMPVMEFPESPSAGVPPYDHFRPYLYSKTLRYSFGSIKGRERDRWQPAVQSKFFDGATLDQQAGMIRTKAANVRAAVDELLRLGFSAIYVNRNGFPDRGRGIEDALLEIGYDTPPIRSDTGDLVCYVLKPRP